MKSLIPRIVAVAAMRKYGIALGIVGCLLVGACCFRPTSKVEVAPVAFTHADEVVRGEGFMVLADRRIFAVMAFLNATGFDDEVAGRTMHPVRVRVREMLENRLATHAAKRQAWRDYHAKAALPVFCYLDFALSLNSAAPFRRIRPDNELGYPHTAQRLKDFPAVLNDFWVTADLDQAWSAVKPDYLAEIQRYSFEKMKLQLSTLWEYLRMERRDSWVLVQVPNLLDRHYHAIGARYEGYYYSVESPGSGGHALNIHEYLHSIVNPLVEAQYDRFQSRLYPYYQAGVQGPFSESYRHPPTFTFECLVRALDHRLRLRLEGPAQQAQVENRIADLTRDGLTLTQPFYTLLADYEDSGMSFAEFLPVMLGKLPEYRPKSAK